MRELKMLGSMCLGYYDTKSAFLIVVLTAEQQAPFAIRTDPVTLATPLHRAALNGKSDMVEAMIVKMRYVYVAMVIMST